MSRQSRLAKQWGRKKWRNLTDDERLSKNKISVCGIETVKWTDSDIYDTFIVQDIHKWTGHSWLPQVNKARESVWNSSSDRQVALAEHNTNWEYNKQPVRNYAGTMSTEGAYGSVSRTGPPGSIIPYDHDKLFWAPHQFTYNQQEDNL